MIVGNSTTCDHECDVRFSPVRIFLEISFTSFMSWLLSSFASEY